MRARFEDLQTITSSTGKKLVRGPKGRLFQPRLRPPEGGLFHHVHARLKAGSSTKGVLKLLSL
jgi:hypothetical protein